MIDGAVEDQRPAVGGGRGYIVSGGRGKVLRSPVSSAEYWLSKLLVWKFPETVGLTRTFTATTTQLQASGLKPKSQRDSCWEFSRLRHGRWFFYRRRVHFLRKKKKVQKHEEKNQQELRFQGSFSQTKSQIFAAVSIEWCEAHRL